MKTTDFDYYLPADRIAQQPVEPRDSAQLMVLDRSTGKIEHRVFREIIDYLLPGDLLVLNNTRVIPARLYARKVKTGGKAEVLLLDRKDSGLWQALIGGHRIQTGTRLELKNRDGSASGVEGEIIEQLGGGKAIIRFDQPADDWLEKLGHTPLPPYITEYRGDPERYQTIYARREGSAAAPTAGLHFTPDLLIQLGEKGIGLAMVNLKIGLDTFKPISEPDIHSHVIHTEWAQIDAATARQINETRLAGGRIVAVGTTSVRTLETAARSGACNDLGTCGWQTVSAFEGSTDLYITPGFKFRAVDLMITNFHLPRSSLIVLVSAFAGLETIKRSYEIAIEHRYRFYSFGDAMLIL